MSKLVPATLTTTHVRTLSLYISLELATVSKSSFTTTTNTTFKSSKRH